METGFVEVEGGKLYYEVAGNGLPLVFIHAGVADHTLWDEQVNYFKQFYRVVRYDCRGFGKTITTEAGVSYSNRQDLLDLLNFLNIEKAVVIGLSRGGNIATDFTLEFPDRVVGLVVVGSGPNGYESNPPPEEQQLFEQYEQLEENGDTEKLIELELKIWVEGFGRPEGEHPANTILEKMRQMMQTNYAKKEPETQVRALNPGAKDRLEEIKVPTLVIHGGRDASYVGVAAQKLAEGVAGAQRIFLPDVAHMVNLEKPQEFNQLLHDFLKNAHL